MRQAVSRDSARMLAALGILAYAASMMTHEALGHGVYCLAIGGHNVMLTAWRETCNFPDVQGPGIKAAGPGVQFGAGLLAWLMLHLLSHNATRLRYFLWLYMAFDLLVSSGYVLFSGVTKFGDAAEIIAGLHPSISWRAGLVLFGSLTYFLSMLAVAFELKRMAGPDDGARRLFRLVWIPYATAAIFACGTAALNRTMGQEAAIGLAAASSFGAASGLFGLPALQRGMVSKVPSPTIYISWSAAWGVVAAVVILLFLFFIGPGLRR